MHNMRDLLNCSEEELNIFHDLLNKMPPVKKVEDPTFLAISGFPNYENVVSNLYQFFLSANNHGFKHLFLEALNECLPDEDLWMTSYTVEREFITKKGGRIDLVIREESNSKGDTEKAIFIENKIFHHLHNDLDDYYATFEEAGTCAGIVLSLDSTVVPKGFYNITHLQWIKQVQNKLGDYITKAHPKYLALLQDLITHIHSFYKKQTDMETLNFLYKRGPEIQKLFALQEEAFTHLSHEISLVLPEVGWQWGRTSAWSISIKQANDTIYLYFYFDNLFEEDHSFNVTLYLKGEKLVEKWNNTIYYKRTEAVSGKFNIELPPDTTKDKIWAETAKKTYKINKPEELYDFRDYIRRIITEEWEPLISEIKKNFKIV